MRDCFFFHNPKAGGTALRDALARYFPASRIAPNIDMIPEAHGLEAAPPLPKAYGYYAGHYGFDQFKTVAANHIQVTNFRHPATRIKSLYEYFRYSVPDSPELRDRPEFFAVRLARDCDFAGFVSNPDPRVMTYTSNHHFRQLANSGWSLTYSRSAAEIFRMIDEMAWYYVCEYPELSVRWAASALGAPDFAVDIANVTPTAANLSSNVLGLSPRTFGRLMEMNQLDLTIYAHAMGRFFSEVRDLAFVDAAPASRADAWASAKQRVA